MIDNQIMRNAIQKSACVQNHFLALETEEETEECFLHQILADVMIAAFAIAIAKDASWIEII